MRRFHIQGSTGHAIAALALAGVLALPFPNANAEPSKNAAKESAKSETAKSAPKSADGPEVRYFTSLGDLLGDLPVDSFIKETRQNGKVTSATIDVCYPVSASLDRKDRFAIDLKIDGQKLTGNGESFETKTPVTVVLTRKPNDKGGDKTVTFEGKITIGSNASLVSSTDNGDLSEQEFQRTQVSDDDISEKPDGFTEVSPQSIAAKVKREGFADLVKSLRGQNVQVSLESITTDCNVLRTGLQVLRLTVDPWRSQPLVATLKSAPGVIAAGWTSGTYDMERAVRLAAADWRDGDKLNRDKIAAALSESVAKAMAATPASATWNDKTGEVTLLVKRPSQLAPSLNLTERLEIPVLVGPEKIADANRLVVWLGVATSKTVDESSGPHLEFTDIAGSDEENSFSDDDGLVKAVATDLKGQRWDSGKSAWR
jgi:hypothetical protein